MVGVGPGSAAAAAEVVAGAAGTGWEVGEEVWPLVCGGTSPFTSAMVTALRGLKVWNVRC